jgi:ketosteroid isomerase-like protein
LLREASARRSPARSDREIFQLPLQPVDRKARISNLLKRIFNILWIYLKGAKTYLVRGALGPTETIDMTTNPNETAKDAVNRAAQEIMAAFEAKDSAKVISCYAPDAVIATTGRPAAKDGEAVSKAIRDDIADINFKISLSNEKTEVAGSGDLAYRRGTFKITFTNPQTKQAENGTGTYLTVFRKQADGSWKTVEDFGV